MKCARGLERVEHVHVMGPAFGPIFPWMHRCVRADVTGAPIGRRAFAVMPLQRTRIIDGFVAEQLPKFFQSPWHFFNQAEPIVMTDLVAKMTEQRAIDLAESNAH